MTIDLSHLQVKMTGSVQWPSPGEMRAKLREVWRRHDTLEAKEMLTSVDTMTDAEVLEAYKTAMVG